MVTGIEEVASIRRLPTMQANSLGGSRQESVSGFRPVQFRQAGMRWLGIGVSVLSAFTRPEVKSVQHDHALVQALGNIVGNIVP